MKGRFITFEGGEGSGKTTQIRLAAEWLKAHGVSVLTTAEPGGTPLGLKIREILLNRGVCAVGAEAELLLFAAARAQHVREAILPALAKGTWVLCDRFADATVAYQGSGRGLAAGIIRTLNDFSSLALKPDRTLLFDLPITMGLARAAQRAGAGPRAAAEDRFEQEDRDFHEKIREGYLTLAAGEPERFRIIDAVDDVETVHREVRRHLEELLSYRTPPRPGVARKAGPKLRDHDL